MQTATCPEEIEIPAAPESPPHEHVVSLSKGHPAGTGCRAGQGRGGRDLGKPSWACISTKMTLPPNSPSGDFPPSVLPSWEERLVHPTPAPGQGEKMPRRWLIFLGSREASEQSSLLPHSPPAMLRMQTISHGTGNHEATLSPASPNICFANR